MNRDLQQLECEVEREYRNGAALFGTTPSLSTQALQRIRAAVAEEATSGARRGPGVWIGRLGLAACVALALCVPVWTPRQGQTNFASLVEAEPATINDWLDAAIESGEQLSLLQAQYSVADSVDSLSGEESLEDSLDSLEDSINLLEGVFGA